MIFDEKNHFFKNHGYGDVEVVDISVVDAYSGVEVWMLIFMGEASKSFLKKNSNLNWRHPLTKININKSCYVEK
jgi:hypothetical protein